MGRERERQYVTGETPGVVYIVCFDEALGNPDNPRAQAKHYLGWTIDLARRITLHIAGRGAPIIRAAVERGIGLMIFAFHGTPADERRLKQTYKKTPCLCPRCAGAKCRMKLQPVSQTLLALDDNSDDWPAAPATWSTFDGYQMAKLCGWRRARPDGLVLPVEESNTEDGPAWHIPF